MWVWAIWNDKSFSLPPFASSCVFFCPNKENFLFSLLNGDGEHTGSVSKYKGTFDARHWNVQSWILQTEKKFVSQKCWNATLRIQKRNDTFVSTNKRFSLCSLKVDCSSNGDDGYGGDSVLLCVCATIFRLDEWFMPSNLNINHFNINIINIRCFPKRFFFFAFSLSHSLCFFRRISCFLKHLSLERVFDSLLYGI